MSDVERELGFIRKELAELLSRNGTRPVAVPMDVAAGMVGLGLTKFKELVRKGFLATFSVGRRRLVRVAELERWAEAQTIPVPVRVPKTRRKTEGDKIRALLKR